MEAGLKKALNYFCLILKSKKNYFQPSADDKSIEYLDQDGNKIESNFTHTLGK